MKSKTNSLRHSTSSHIQYGIIIMTIIIRLQIHKPGFSMPLYKHALNQNNYVHTTLAYLNQTAAN